METIKQKFPRRGLVLFVAVFLTILILIIAVLKKSTPPTLPVASPTIEKTPLTNRALSTLATDSGFIRLEEDLRLLDQDLGNVDLSEPTLALPNLEMKVSF